MHGQYNEKADCKSNCSFHLIGINLSNQGRFLEATELAPLITNPVKRSVYWQGIVMRFITAKRFSEAIIYPPNVTDDLARYSCFMEMVSQAKQLLTCDERKSVLEEIAKQAQKHLDEKRLGIVLSQISRN